jgi:hypothetical protein
MLQHEGGKVLSLILDEHAACAANPDEATRSNPLVLSYKRSCMRTVCVMVEHAMAEAGAGLGNSEDNPDGSSSSSSGAGVAAASSSPIGVALAQKLVECLAGDGEERNEWNDYDESAKTRKEMTERERERSSEEKRVLVVFVLCVFTGIICKQVFFMPIICVTYPCRVSAS